jgi:hypothetical protein
VRSSPERRRLRFSFHINNVKDPEPKLPEPPLGRTIRLAPDVGGGGYLSNLEFRVKPFFNKTVRTNPPNQPEGKSSRPWRPSREERQSSQEESFRKLFLDLKNNFRCSRELSSVTPGRAVSSKTNQPCQPRIPLNFSKSSKSNTSPNLGILIELFASVRSGASIEASIQSQPPRFLSFQRAEATKKRQKGIRGLPRLPAWIHNRVDWSAEPNETSRRKQEPCGSSPAVAIAFPSEGRI